MSVRLEHGDCREVIKTLADCSVDSGVMDPPYSLVSIQKRFGRPGSAPAISNGASGVYKRASSGFMGQQWDTGETAFDPAWWAEVLRVLKPGGYLVAFGGTRSAHRMVCAIEDAGFEIRDSISYLYDGGIAGPLLWAYGSGFPKSHDTGKALDAAKKRCSCDEKLPSVRRGVGAGDPVSGRQKQDVRADLRADATVDGSGGAREEAANDVRLLREADQDAAAVKDAGRRSGVLQQEMLGQNAGTAPEIDQREGTCGDYVGDEETLGHARREEPGMEGRRHTAQETGQLRIGSVRPLSSGVHVDGEGGRLRDGAPPSDGAVDRTPAAPDRVRSPRGSQAAAQRADESGALAGQPQPQDGGAWPHCGRCGKPIVPDGLGTALKPAHEPICLARKPLAGTVAANVLQHGTGAINIDGCRIESGEDHAANCDRVNVKSHWGNGITTADISANPLGRWPANLIHDGSEEVLACFPEQSGGGTPKRRISPKTAGVYGKFAHEMEVMPDGIGGSSGNAARFFFSAKADADDRWGSKHPTVKPIDLMRWLARLVTPPGGLVLDPFAGSGTTGVACLAEGFNAILIEREAEYVADIRARLDHYEGRGGHSMSVKNRNRKPADETPLFGRAAE